MPKILIAVDGSDHSLQAARRAAAMGGPDADYVMLSVVPPWSPLAALGLEDDVEVPVGGSSFGSSTAGGNVMQPFAPTPDHVAAVTKATTDHYREAQLEAERSAGIVADKRIEEGKLRHRKIGKVICNVAAEEGADAVVVGASGSHFGGEATLGSVAHYVLHHAPCSVVVVPTQA